jgi:hypothetical protein
VCFRPARATVSLTPSYGRRIVFENSTPCDSGTSRREVSMADEPSPNDETSTVPCPFCKEPIQEGALKCKHCKSLLAAEKPDHEGTCPFCRETIQRDAVKCRYCGSWVGPASLSFSPCPCGRSHPVHQPGAFSVGSGVAPGLMPGTSLQRKGQRGYVGPVPAFGRFESGGGPIELPDPIPCELCLRCASVFGYLVCWWECCVV